ncbi:transcription-repair coupling factor [candidate division KSB1 bacterium]|nr:transcription-repair coupling factor [candidate division KSB1 bacterium]
MLMTAVDKIRSAFSGEKNLDVVQNRVEQHRNVTVATLAGSATAFLISSLHQRLRRKFFCVCESESQAEHFFADIRELVDDEKVVYYPALGAKLWNELGPLRSQVGGRILALDALMTKTARFFITAAPALLEKVADPADVELYSLSLQVGDTTPFDLFVKQLVEMGFSREERVDIPGEMSVRGGLVDVFLFERPNPFRIEFWGDTIESIRSFDAETQRSVEKCSALRILPLGCAGPYGPVEARTLLDLDLKCTVFDYLDEEFVLWLENKALIQAALRDHERQAMVHFESVAEAGAPDEPAYGDYYSSADELDERLQKRPVIQVKPFADQDENAIHFGIRENGHYGGNLKLFRQDFDHLLSTKAPPVVCLVCDTDSQRDRMIELFREEGFPPLIHICTLNLSHGFSWPAKNLHVFTTRELYSRIRMHALSPVQRGSVSFRERLSIKKGDYVVHNDYGVGSFGGLEKIKAYGKVRECLTLFYQDGDKLYVPLEKMDQVQKYSSAEGAVPVLNKLGSPNWERLKKRTKKRMREITEDLIKLYATRKMRPGYAFSEDTVWQKELEASFQFEETVDQLSAIAEVKKDMQAAQPMDRLICGDVGYGKTEVAVRAAFKAVTDGRQVAILVPTTILAEQHFATFQQRLAQFPVLVEVISRFKTTGQQKNILEKLANGEVDIIIGTHRLLSKDVQFNDLGLLIIDEEQRFGVIHKEKIKLLKQTVDTLTLSATPIPRTMHLALMGAKDMSIINSPPHNRLAIKTEVSRFDRELVREAILREMDRGGQVFFVHNRVQSIHGVSALLNEIVPEANIAVAHGQMKGHQLEKIMLQFIEGKVHVLVCTMIIESGIDMPNANTLIIHRADKFGLAQLYQLRGRVGRSDQQAYAYLLIPSMRKMTRDAIKRLQTIQEYSELGAGYKIAMRDLEIRGAGNVFGAEQTGFINALGYELYTKIIQETIAEIRRDLNMNDDVQVDDSFAAKVECDADAYLPENYVTSSAERVDIYRRLVRARKATEVDDMRTELLDRFGDIPAQAQNLIDYILIKMAARQLRLKKVTIHNGRLSGEFDYAAIPQGDKFRPWLADIIRQAPDSFELLHGEEKLGFAMTMSRKETNLTDAKKFLQSML